MNLHKPKNLMKWRKKYPEYKFTQQDKNSRWSSPIIDKIIDIYENIHKLFRKLKLHDLITYYNCHLYPTAPQLHPLESERETIYYFKKLKKCFKDLYKTTKEIYEQILQNKDKKAEYHFRQYLNNFKEIYKKIEQVEELQNIQKIQDIIDTQKIKKIRRYKKYNYERLDDVID